METLFKGPNDINLIAEISPAQLINLCSRKMMITSYKKLNGLKELLDTFSLTYEKVIDRKDLRDTNDHRVFRKPLVLVNDTETQRFLVGYWSFALGYTSLLYSMSEGRHSIFEAKEDLKREIAEFYQDKSKNIFESEIENFFKRYGFIGKKGVNLKVSGFPGEIDGIYYHPFHKLLLIIECKYLTGNPDMSSVKSELDEFYFKKDKPFIPHFESKVWWCLKNIDIITCEVNLNLNSSLLVLPLMITRHQHFSAFFSKNVLVLTYRQLQEQEDHLIEFLSNQKLAINWVISS